jgi:hypothetical protein
MVPQDTCPIATLLPEVLERIFSILKDSDTLSVRLGCKFWNEKIVSIALTNILEIKNFVNFLNGNIETKYESHKAAFLKLQESAKPLIAFKKEEFPCGKFIQGRSQLKTNFFNILMKIELTKINELKELANEKVQLNCFEHVFDVAQIYKRIEEMDKMPFDDLKAATIKRIGLDLAIALGSSEKTQNAGVLTISMSIIGLKPVLRKGLSTDDIVSAITYLLYTSRFEERNSLSYDIAKTLTLHGEVKLALHFLQDIRNWNERYLAYTELAKILGKMNQIEKALEVTLMINDKELIDSAHAELSRILAQMNQIEKALEVTTMIKDEKVKASTYEMIFATTQEPYIKK